MKYKTEIMAPLTNRCTNKIIYIVNIIDTHSDIITAK